MVYSEATLALPLIAGYAYHKGAWKNRAERRWSPTVVGINGESASKYL